VTGWTDPFVVEAERVGRLLAEAHRKLLMIAARRQYRGGLANRERPALLALFSDDRCATCWTR